MNAYIYIYGLVMFVVFIVYVLSIAAAFARKKPDPVGDPDEFDWHFFIPCLNEESVIKATVLKLRSDFPQSHVWIVDDASDDGSLPILARLARSDDFVHVIVRNKASARTGKGAALNVAYAALNQWISRRDVNRRKTIVCVMDADGELSQNALRIVSSGKVFGDPTVGAAQPVVWMRNRAELEPLLGRSRVANAFSRWLLRMQDVEFRTIIAGMQSLRKVTKTVALGGNGQFTRLSALDKIASEYGKPWHGSLLEDYELGVHVLLAGYRTVSVYDAYVAQEAIPEFGRFIRQRSRWSQGNIQCVRYIPRMFWSKNFSNAGFVESSYYLLLPFLQMAAMIFAVVMFAASVVFAVQNPTLVFANMSLNSWAVMAGVLLLSVALFAVWGPIYKLKAEPSLTWRRSLWYGLGVWVYSSYMYFCLPIAFWRVLTRQNSWLKTKHGVVK